MKLSGRQLAIMRVLWDRGEATAAEVQRYLDVERPLAYLTVATVMSRMAQKGLIRHRAEGRVYRYLPAISEDGVGESMVGELVNRIFSGRPSQLVSHLLDSEHVDAEKLQRIKQLLEEHEMRRRQPPGES